MIDDISASPWGSTKGSLVTSVPSTSTANPFSQHTHTTTSSSGTWGDTTTMANTIEEQQDRIEELERLVKRLVEEFLPEELV